MRFRCWLLGCDAPHSEDIPVCVRCDHDMSEAYYFRFGPLWRRIIWETWLLSCFVVHRCGYCERWKWFTKGSDHFYCAECQKVDQAESIPF